jgi:hypothetical protein
MAVTSISCAVNFISMAINITYITNDQRKHPEAVDFSG